MVEPNQQSLYSIPPDDHLAMIARMRERRDALRRRMIDHFAVRQKIAQRVNLATAEFEDRVHGIGLSNDEREARNQMASALDKRDRANADMAAALAKQRELKAALDVAQSDLELSIGGIQRSIIEEAAHVEPTQHQTAKSLRTARQRAVAEACIKALRALGGQASCIDLASLVGVSSHGLGGLIDTDPRLRKLHDGRIGNVQTHYELVDGA